MHLFKSGGGSFGEATVAYSWKIPTVETLSEFQIEPRVLLYVPNKINKPVLVDVAVHHFVRHLEKASLDYLVWSNTRLSDRVSFNNHSIRV